MDQIKKAITTFSFLGSLFFLGYGLVNMINTRKLEVDTQIMADKILQVETRTEKLEKISESSTKRTILAEIEAQQLAIEIKKCN